MNRMIPQYSTMLFTDVWNNAEDFVTDYKESGLYDATSASVLNNSLSDAAATKLFYLLYARYGNSPLANRDVHQFQYKVFSIIFQYGPKWEKDLDIQVKVRALSDTTPGEGIFAGSRTIYNAAANPSTEPSTGTLDELTFINQQNTTNYKRSPLEAYAMLEDLLKDDISKLFVDKFAICFKKFVSNERPIIYVSEEDEEDDGN